MSVKAGSSRIAELMGEAEPLKVHPAEGSEGTDRCALAETGIVIAQDANLDMLLEPLPGVAGADSI
ncbi:hypothetical protein GGI05_002910 [Coemansia sp. RSA 2603]|nr:hypothetical protein GGI05_002910 [Coemansia sp. RSA 2603]